MKKKEQKNKVLLCVNSDIGRGNTIGFRFGQIAHELKRRGIDFDIIGRANYDKSLKVKTPIYKNYLGRILNATRIYLLPFLNYRDFEVYCFDKFVLRQIKKNQQNYQLVHFGEFTPQSIKYLKDRDIKVYLDMPIGHGQYSIKLKSEGIKVGEKVENISPKIKQTIDLVDVVVAPSEFVVATLKLAGFGNKRNEIVPFGVNLPENFSQSSIANRLENNKKVVYLFAGNVNYRKGIKYLLEAWQKANLATAELIICGRIYKELRQEIKKYNFKNVKFVGFVAVKNYYKKAHVFVFPTLLEGSAKVVYEAMSYGLPVITTFNAGSIVVDNESGFIIPVGDASALSEKMQYFFNNQDKIVKMGENAFASVKKYTWEDYSKKVVDNYNL